jgi:hypothetical protein
MDNKEKTFSAALVKELCIICTKEIDGPIIINTILSVSAATKVENMNGKVVGFAENPCKECQDNLQKAFLFISYDEEKSDLERLPEGFYRTGYIVGTKKDIPLVKNFIANNHVLAFKKGYIFMPHQVMKELNLIQE